MATGALLTGARLFYPQSLEPWSNQNVVKKCCARDRYHLEHRSGPPRSGIHVLAMEYNNSGWKDTISILSGPLRRRRVVAAVSPTPERRSAASAAAA
eukprot:7004069-Prymnesium_polylepis.2